MSSAGVGRLVVEADVAADDRHVEHAARLGETVDRSREHVHRDGVLGAREVEAVGDADRLGARAHEVATDLGDRHLRALLGGERDEATVAVDGEGEMLHQRLAVALAGHANDARVGAGTDDGSAANDVVVLTPDPGA